MRQRRELEKLLEGERRLVAELQAENAGRKKTEPHTPLRTPTANDLEALRLRGEVTVLRRELAELTNTGAFGASMDAAPKEEKPSLIGDRLFKARNQTDIPPQDHAIRLELNRKEQVLREWWKAVVAYAEANGGNVPVQLSEASEYLPNGLDATIDPSAIDITNFTRSPGSSRPANLAEIENPSRTLLFKERTPLVLSDGVVCNMHIFADGSIELFRD